uniref:Uncharacterized protein n=1 Tax=Ackermannviridae sp. TaxID=2831612 RepID=A0A8S5VMX6_9CAUD|nr:MAG TPA: hypothetical protein [Ackermannviridae sp.]
MPQRIINVFSLIILVINGEGRDLIPTFYFVT